MSWPGAGSRYQVHPPITYAELCRLARDGDLLVADRPILWARPHAHIDRVALLVWLEEGLWAACMERSRRYRLMPAAHWIDLVGMPVHYGQAPPAVYQRQNRVCHLLLCAVDAALGYPTDLALVQRIWSACGVPVLSNRELPPATHIGHRAGEVRLTREDLLAQCQLVSRVQTRRGAAG